MSPSEPLRQVLVVRFRWLSAISRSLWMWVTFETHGDVHVSLLHPVLYVCQNWWILDTADTPTRIGFPRTNNEFFVGLVGLKSGTNPCGMPDLALIIIRFIRFAERAN